VSVTEILTHPLDFRASKSARAAGIAILTCDVDNNFVASFSECHATANKWT
jgi:hypothetical protein